MNNFMEIKKQIESIVPELEKITLSRLSDVSDLRTRFVYEELKKTAFALKDLRQKPVILLYGLRGVGKTTLMLQLLNELDNAIYISADHFYTKSFPLYLLIETLIELGYSNIFIDEIHKVSGWETILKNIYDTHSVLIIASGSSSASIYKGSVFLGRRAFAYNILPLTFSEYLYLSYGSQVVSKLDDLLDKKKTYEWLKNNPLAREKYSEYLHYGGFPFYIKNKSKNYLLQLIKKMIYEDALAEFNLSLKKVTICEKILAFLAKNPISDFSISSFSSKTGIPKSTIHDAIELLLNMNLVTKVSEKRETLPVGEKAKLQFFHPNLRSAFSEDLLIEPDLGSMREEYFVFHSNAYNFPIYLPKKQHKFPDFLINLNREEVIVEIGGFAKTRSQLKEYKDYKTLVFTDDELRVYGCLKQKQR